MGEKPLSLFENIRSACKKVAERARYVRINHEALLTYVGGWGLEPTRPSYDPVHHYLGPPDATAAYVLTLDAVNFGSGYFPHLLKRPGMSGYFTVASHLKDRFDARGPLSAAALRGLTVEDCAAMFGQDLQDPVRAELMNLFAKALNDLGALLLTRYGGSFVALIEAAQGSAERLSTLLADMPYFQDVATYPTVGDRLGGELDVPLYKRAQITASDLSLAFEGQGYGHFADLRRLTIFADNLVPHVLRVDGVLDYDASLAARINAGELIAAGSPEEVEIRAVALHTVEKMVGAFREAGKNVTAQELDFLLWNRGQEPKYKAVPRHRTRTVFY